MTKLRFSFRGLVIFEATILVVGFTSTTQSTITCSKLKIETLEQEKKYVQS